MRQSIPDPLERFRLNDDHFLETVDRCGRRWTSDPVVSDIYGRLWRVRRRSIWEIPGAWICVIAILFTVAAISIGAATG